MYKVVEYLSDGREIIHGYDDTEDEANLRFSHVLTMGRVEDFSFVAIRKVTLC